MSVVFKSVWANNFMAIGAAEVRLDDRGLVFIEGENQDDPSAASNGSGKSSLVDSISWCLYGVTARGVAGDAVVNRKAGRDCEVTTEVEVDGVRWLIQRGRKSKRLKNRVYLKQYDAAFGDWVDHTLGTDKLTQERIDALLGCNAKTFNDAVYMGQERMTDLPAMTDKALKATLEQALSLDRLDEAQNIANIRLENARVVFSARAQDLEEARDEIRNIDDDTADKIKQAENIEFDLTNIKKELGEAVSNHDRTLAEAEARRNRCKTVVNQRAISLRDAEAGVKHAQGPASESLKESYGKLGAKWNELNTQAVDLEVQISKHMDFLSCPSECPTCERKFSDADEMEKQKAVKEEELVALRETRKGVKESIKKVEAMRDMVADTMRKVEHDAKDAYNSAMSNLFVAKRDLEREEETLASLRTSTQVNLLRRWCQEKESTHAALAEEIDALEKERLKQVAHAESLVETFEEAELRVTTLEKVKHVLSRKGFRGEVLDQVTPYLNARTQYYLTWLTSDNISAVWNTVNVTTSGDLSENFHIQVSHREGAESFDGLSGGEKRKVRLACAMALQDLVGTRAVKPIKLFIADEIDDAIDDSGLELLMGLLEEKAKSVGTLMIISHNALGDWCKESITVSKKDGVTTIK